MPGDRIAMNRKERERQVILMGVKGGQLSLIEASKKLRISYRQMKRIYKRYRDVGEIGLIHGNCGKVSHRAYSQTYKEAVLELYRSRYEGFGPWLACEKLSREGYVLSDETLRL